MKLSFIKTLLVVSTLSFCFISQMAIANESQSEIILGPKRLVILRPGVEVVWGSYVFAIENHSNTAAEKAIPFRLPLETVDWAPQEGALPKDLTLGQDGELILKQIFQPGMQMVSIGFKIPAPGGNAALTLKPVIEVNDLTFLHPQSASFKISGSNLENKGLDGNPKDPYQAFVLKGGLKVGESFKIELSGVPAGRTQPYYIGSIIMVLLVVSVVILAIKTRPKALEDNDELLLAAK
jgi:hypothetical protein